MNTSFGKIAIYHATPSDRAELIKAITQYVTQAAQSPGNIMAEGYWERDQENTIWLIERWNDEGAWKNFHSTHALPQSPAKEIAIDDLEPLPKQAWQKQPDPADHPFTAVLMLNAKPGTEAEFKQIYHTAMPQFRGEPGVITYQLSQSTLDKTLFITYEKFRSNDAFQYHLNFPPINPVIHFLRNSIQDPPFEKGLHNLIAFAPKV
jgi:quinol monooxygenase YgiN